MATDFARDQLRAELKGWLLSVLYHSYVVAEQYIFADILAVVLK